MEFFTSLGKVLRDIVPAFAEALPIPGLGNVAKELITNVFDLPKDSKDSDIINAIKNMTSEQWTALQKAKIILNQKALEAGVQLEQINANDRDSARKRQMSMKDDTPNTLAYIVTCSTIILCVAVMFLPVKTDSKIIFYILGTLNTLTVQVFNYFYGTSRSSRKKDSHINQNITPQALAQILHQKSNYKLQPANKDGK